MSVRSVKTLLAVELYELTGKEIGLLKNKYLNKDYFESDVLPKFCLDKDGFIRDTYYWLQFIEEGDEVYRLFEAATIDRLLDQEISSLGLEYILNNVNLTQMFENLKIHKFDDFNRVLPSAEYIIIELIYTSSFNGESTEYDMDTNILGFLNENLEHIKYEKENNEE